MRNAIKAVAAGAAMIMMTIGASYAAPVSNAHLGGAFESGVLQVQYGHCERLRYKCQHKEALGQEGEGNCAALSRGMRRTRQLLRAFAAGLRA